MGFKRFCRPRCVRNDKCHNKLRICREALRNCQQRQSQQIQPSQQTPPSQTILSSMQECSLNIVPGDYIGRFDISKATITIIEFTMSSMLTNNQISTFSGTISLSVSTIFTFTSTQFDLITCQCPSIPPSISGTISGSGTGMFTYEGSSMTPTSFTVSAPGSSESTLELTITPEPPILGHILFITQSLC
jgi:hypothetical protein